MADPMWSSRERSSLSSHRPGLALHGDRMSRYRISLIVDSDFELPLIEAMAESMVDDSMFAMHEVLELNVELDD